MKQFKMPEIQPVFKTERFYAFPLSAENEAAVQTFLEQCQDFQLLTHGEPVQPGEGKELLEDLPPGKQLQDKFLFGIYELEGRLVAVLDLVRDYPDRSTWWIGLLLLLPSERGSGLGRQIFEALLGWLRGEGAEKIGLGVVGENTAAQRFWERNGFQLIAERPPQRFGSKEQIVLVYSRPLEPGA